MPPTAAMPASAYASWIQRVGAYLIDVGPIVVLELIFVRIFIIYLLVLLASIGWTVYNRWYMGGTTGQSLGKRLLINSVESFTTRRCSSRSILKIPHRSP